MVTIIRIWNFVKGNKSLTRVIKYATGQWSDEEGQERIKGGVNAAEGEPLIISN
jgi:hypothetical protein